MAQEKLIQQGAEALILLSNGSVIKRRMKKGYRLPEIDEEIRRLRTRSEGKLLIKAGKEIAVPEVRKVDEKKKEITMDFIRGNKLSDFLDSFSLEEQKKICGQVGNSVSKLHDADMIHGDLTTSNMILVKNRDATVFFIDFGLGFHSHKIEDKAVDLHLLKEALEAKHFKHWHELFEEVKKGYSDSKNTKAVLEQLKKVESRGRYKEVY